GQIVAFADSGLDKGSISDIHPDLRTQEGQMPKVIALNSWAGREKADDPDGHGTHMAATIAGTGAGSEQWQGLAPGASLYFQGLLNAQGQINLPDDLSTLFDPAYAAGARIHVDAWGTSGNYYNDHARQIDTYIQQHRDLLVILAAGNNGSYNGTLTCEANSKNALAVGASASVRLDLDDTYKSSSETASFSSCGPTVDGRIKPEILAPGTSIISACSSQTKSNLSGYSQYTSMQGTSMAAAVTAGSSALLRELLAESWQMPDPSAALMKALLLEGARTDNGPSQKGFGILDLTSTAIAIKENMLMAEDEGIFLQEGLIRNYTYSVSDSQNVFKATLVWSDPPGNDGGENYLVNDLDLIVIAPDGSQLTGNHFLGTGSKDSLNNVEQVYIAAPLPGEYTIRVRGASIGGSSNGQQFALTYGQIPASRLLTETELQSEQDVLVLDHQLQEAEIPLAPGYRQYQTPNRRYVWGKTWNPAGVGVRSNSQGILWYLADQEDRIGGYQQAAGAKVQINGSAASMNEEAQIPVGSGLQAVIDPLTQTLQTARAAYQIYQGKVISTGSAEQKSLMLEGYQNSFAVAEQAVYKNDYHIIESDQFLSAFGSLEIGEYQNILAGMMVCLV
ncbi:MAG: S8 family serine peptidase, partial [Clostridia bacterium]|nr:S8 family serine peptidase [Clostridia bacterium]